MNSREQVKMVFNRISVSGSGVFWTGHPNEATLPIYGEAFGISPTRESIYSYLGDDCRFLPADSCYKHPEGRSAMNHFNGKLKSTLSAGGAFSEAEAVSDVNKHDWPDTKYLDFTELYETIKGFKDKSVFTGLWSPFFHDLCFFFGMENYFIQMYENPALVEAVTERVVDYYVEANELFFSGLGDAADTMFFGNDFGTQLDLFISPEMFRKFVLPSFKRIIAVGKKHQKFIMLHSCGSIARIIPDLIDAGVDVLHPIQAQAVGMNADNLAQYKNDLAFVGGIDAQSFFVDATPDEIKNEVRRVRKILGPNIVISPSHEEILPNIPSANIKAMAEASREPM